MQYLGERAWGWDRSDLGMRGWLERGKLFSFQKEG